MNNVFGTIGLVNINVSSPFNSPILTPSSYFIRTINGVRSTTIYYDPDIFNNLIVISASLLIGGDIKPWRLHYNTIHDEDLGTSGTAWQELKDIGIAIYPKPQRTNIIGVQRMDINTTQKYNIINTYDLNNLFIYDWYIVGSAYFTLNNSTTLLNGGKEIFIHFTAIDTVTLKLKVSNPSGCFRWIIRNIYPGTLTKKLMVVRYPYF